VTSGWYSGLHTLFFSRQGGGDVSEISEMKIDQAANERGIDLTPSVWSTSNPGRLRVVGFGNLSESVRSSV
jgi:hypothetical protein